MKKIAIDLDGVVFDSENLYRVYSEMYDVDFFKGNNVVNNSERTFQKRYSWSLEESHIFYDKCAKEVLENANVMTGAETVLKKLSSEFDLVVVTARNDEELEIAKNKINDMGFDLNYFNNEKHKIDRLINEGVDFIIDDDVNICINASNKGIKALYFKNAAVDLIEENDYLKIVNNWGEVYKYFMIN